MKKDLQQKYSFFNFNDFTVTEGRELCITPADNSEVVRYWDYERNDALENELKKQTAELIGIIDFLLKSMNETQLFIHRSEKRWITYNQNLAEKIFENFRTSIYAQGWQITYEERNG